MSKIAIEYSKVQAIIESITNAQLKALVAAQYASAARISEILELKKSNITDRGEYLELQIPNRKNSKDTIKNAILLKTKEPWLFEPITFWISITPNDKIFKWGNRRARELILRATGYSSHYFRHSRATHLAQEFNFDAFDIKNALGHARLETSVIYVHKKTQDRAFKMLNR